LTISPLNARDVTVFLYQSKFEEPNVENSIGERAIKIACLQVFPGYEYEVKSRLADACEKQDEVEEYIFLKGVGNFDLIIMYATEDYGYHLRTAGPIKKILKSNLLLCYPYLKKDTQKIFRSVDANIFTSFSLLKISPGLKKFHPEIDKALRKYVSSQNDDWSLLGTLGWNELILLFSGNQLQGIIDSIYDLGRIAFANEKERIAVFLKTLSFVGLNYKYLPSEDLVKKGFKHVKSFLDKTPQFRNSKLNSSPSAIFPTIEITTKFIYTTEVIKYFKAKGFEHSYSIGKRDIVFRPVQKSLSWSSLLASIIYFRMQFKNKIFSTNTRIGFEKETKNISKLEELGASVPSFDFEYDDLVKIFGDIMASNLASQIYTLNALFQDPLCGSVYADMAEYPKFIYDTGKDYINLGLNPLYFGHKAREIIRLGAEIRSYGTYETIEEVTGRFSEFRGGCQLSLLAIEFLPSFVLERIGIEWKGFVVAGDPKFFHMNEVINVPTEALWKPQTWWALYHEIAHIVVENIDLFIGRDLPVIEKVMANKSPNYYDFIIELTAEIIGFELGFFGKYDRFFELIWNHLSEIDPYQMAHIPISEYAIRSFFLELFEGHFRPKSDARKISKQEFTNLDLLYEAFIQHMCRIEAFVKKPYFTDKEFIAARSVKAIRNLFPLAQHLSKTIRNIITVPNPHSLMHGKTKEIVVALKNGTIWWDKIKYPEAVLFAIFEDSNVNFKTRIATIISFWNQQMQRYSQRLQ